MIQFYVRPTTTQQASLQPFFIVTRSDLRAGDTWPFNAGVFLLTNVAVGGTLGGSTAGTRTPDDMIIDYVRQYTPSAGSAPVLGSPPSITVTAGATTGNTSTFTPTLATGNGYVYFSCDTTAPKASCSVKTDDPLNRFVVNSDATLPESVTVTVETTSDAWGAQRLLNRKMRRPVIPIFAFVIIVALVALAQTIGVRPGFRYAIVLAGAILSAALVVGCGGGGSSSGGGSPGSGGGGGSGGTAPGNYSVTVYAFNEANDTAGRNSNADVHVVIPVTVN